VKSQDRRSTPSRPTPKPSPARSRCHFKDLDDKNATLSQYKGKVVLVNFWATWCEPSTIEFLGSSKMQQKYEARGSPFSASLWTKTAKGAVAPFLAKERFNVNARNSP